MTRVNLLRPVRRGMRFNLRPRDRATATGWAWTWSPEVPRLLLTVGGSVLSVGAWGRGKCAVQSWMSR